MSLGADQAVRAHGCAPLKAPTDLGLTHIALATGFLTSIKRLQLRFFVQKPGFCVSPRINKPLFQCDGYAVG